MDISWPQTGSWALAACMALTLVLLVLLRKWKKRDDARERLRAAAAEYNEAVAQYHAAVQVGTVEDGLEAARKVKAAADRVQAAEKALACLLVASCLFTAGCLHTRTPKETIVTLTDHVRIVEPGATVPDYPDGETRWWLLTPRGMAEMVPGEAYP